jgi:HK97 family phage prohead protease
MLAQTDFARPAAAIAPDGTVEGYASLFGEIDQARDMVMPGAFEASLRRRGVRRVPMLFQHDPSEPIGVWLDLHEDVHGLYARGRLIPEVMRARELLALLRAGTTDGLSIGFRTVKGRIDPKTRIRKLEAIDLWEISIVTFPLLPGARVRAVKEASPAMASAASGQRGRAQTSPHREALHARTRSPARKSGPVDRSLSRLAPERVFRRQPHFSFTRNDGGATERMGWRDLVLSESALCAAPAGGRRAPPNPNR